MALQPRQMNSIRVVAIAVVVTETVVHWRRGLVVITITQLNSTKLQLRFCAGSTPACDVSNVFDSENSR